MWPPHPELYSQYNLGFILLTAGWLNVSDTLVSLIIGQGVKEVVHFCQASMDVHVSLQRGHVHLEEKLDVIFERNVFVVNKVISLLTQ